jgi:uncharacterized protein YcnI
MRALKVVVVAMGVLILAGLAVVAITVAKRASGPTEKPGTFETATLAVPSGCRVIEMVPAGERLLLRLGEGERCRAILVVDLKTGAELGRLDLVEAP